MYRRHFCLSWLEVRDTVVNKVIYIQRASGLGDFADEAEVAFWTGIMGTSNC